MIAIFGNVVRLTLVSPTLAPHFNRLVSSSAALPSSSLIRGSSGRLPTYHRSLFNSNKNVEHTATESMDSETIYEALGEVIPVNQKNKSKVSVSIDEGFGALEEEGVSPLQPIFNHEMTGIHYNKLLPLLTEFTKCFP